MIVDLIFNIDFLLCILYMPTIMKNRNFEKISCLRFAKIMNNTTIINTSNSDNSNIAYINT